MDKNVIKKYCWGNFSRCCLDQNFGGIANPVSNGFPHKSFVGILTAVIMYHMARWRGSRHRGERLGVSAQGTMFKSLSRLHNSRLFLFHAQE